MAAAPETTNVSPVDSAVAEAMPALIAAKAKAGDLRGAKALAEEHLKGRDAYRRVWMAAIAAAQAEAGDLDGALATIKLAGALAQAGDLDGAVRLADDQSEVEWLADIAVIALGRNRDAEARRVVERLRRASLAHPEAARSLGPRLAVIEARLGDAKALDGMAGQLEANLRAEHDADRRRQIEAMLFGLYVGAGRMGDARRLVRGKPARDVDILIAWAVAAAAESGDLKRAEELTFLLPTPGSREFYVAGLAVAHRKAAGDHSTTAWIDRLPTPHDRAAAYLGLADPILSR